MRTMQPKTRKPCPSGVTVTMTKRGYRMKAFGPNAPDLRTVVPGLFGSVKPFEPRPDRVQESTPFAQEVAATSAQCPQEVDAVETSAQRPQEVAETSGHHLKETSTSRNITTHRSKPK